MLEIFGLVAVLPIGLLAGILMLERREGRSTGHAQ